MQIDTAGTYLLKYTAEDECGNVTEVTREVVAEIPATYRTVLYKDGTFIINESSRDQAANEALHGVATNVYDPFDPNGDTDAKKYIFTGAAQRPWNSQASSIKAVEIGSNIRPTKTAYWFNGFTTCTSMNLDMLNTSLVTNMSDMFRSCQALTTLDLTNFDTSSVTSMNSMFNYCQALTTLDLTNFDTSSVKDMSGMFRSCQALTTLDLTNFNTSSVMSMSDMFRSCQALTTLDLTNFNTSSVTSMNGMFNSCQALTTLDLTNFNTSSVTNMNSMFNYCQALTTLDLTNFDTSSVKDMKSMFNYCQALTTIYASLSFAVTQVTASSSMFASMSTNLVGGVGTTWSSSNPTDKTYAHIDGGTSDPGYFTLKSA